MTPQLLFRVLQGSGDFNTLVEETFKQVCKDALEAISIALESIDETIMETRDKKRYRYIRKDKRTISLPFGDLTFSRRYYCEEKDIDGRKIKQYHYLLDEKLNIPSDKRVYGGIMVEGVVKTATMSYRQAAKEANKYGIKTLSHTTLWKKAREIGLKKAGEENQKQKEIYEQGCSLESPTHTQSKILFAESDGVIVNLQQEKQKRAEVKLFICHEGWEPRYPGSTEYATKNKWCYAAYEGCEEFWEKVSIELANRYDLTKIQQTILNGDGAEWVKTGTEYLPNSVYQLDPFHLNQQLTMVYGNQPDVIAKIRRYIEEDDYENMYRLIDTTAGQKDIKKKKEILRLKSYLRDNQEGLKDYRKRGIKFNDDIQLRGMGNAESSIDKILANRLKKKGMSWSIEGIISMSKILQLFANGELESYLKICFEGSHYKEGTKLSNEVVQKAEDKVKSCAGVYGRQVHMTIFDAPRREWIKALKQLVSINSGYMHFN